MRRSQETSIVRNQEGKFIGIAMKADYTAEHEWGIKELKKTLGLRDTKLGIAGRIINDSSRLYLLKGIKGVYLCASAYSTPDVERLDKDAELHVFATETLSSAWSSCGFCIYANGKENIAALEEIYAHAPKKNVALGLGDVELSNPFSRAGLNIMIVSNMPNDILQNIYKEDLDYHNLQKADKKTKLQKDIEVKYSNDWMRKPHIRAAWSKGHFARRDDKSIAETTKYSVVYWLTAQGYHGWYTVEEIRQWLKTGKGIIEDEKTC